MDLGERRGREVLEEVDGGKTVVVKTVYERRIYFQQKGSYPFENIFQSFKNTNIVFTSTSFLFVNPYKSNTVKSLRFLAINGTTKGHKHSPK